MFKVKNFKKGLKELNKRSFSQITTKVVQRKEELNSIQKQLQMQPLNVELKLTKKNCMVKYNELLIIEEKFYRDKARTKWLVEGDRKTMYFHRKVKVNQTKNRIMSLCSN